MAEIKERTYRYMTQAELTSSALIRKKDENDYLNLLVRGNPSGANRPALPRRPSQCAVFSSR